MVVGSAAVQPGGSQERPEADLGAARLPAAELTSRAEVSRRRSRGGIFTSLTCRICVKPEVVTSRSARSHLLYSGVERCQDFGWGFFCSFENIFHIFN